MWHCVHRPYVSLFYGWLNKLEYCHRLCWHRNHSDKQVGDSTIQRNTQLFFLLFLSLFFPFRTSAVTVVGYIFCLYFTLSVLQQFFFLHFGAQTNTYILYITCIYILFVFVSVIIVVLGAKMLGRFLTEHS